VSNEVPSRSWFAAGVIPRRGKPADLLVIRYWYDWNPTARGSSHAQQVKFPGGSRRVDTGNPDRTPEDTLVRELREEVLRGEEGRVDGLLLLHVEDVIAPGRDVHTKYYFLVGALEGDLRDRDLFEVSRGRAEAPGGRQRAERMSPPCFIDVASLAEVIFKRHAPALRAYCERLVHDGNLAPEARSAMNSLDRRGL
jgi:ADP-ribose pyrophosphatase YjhB (NUDIX family)